MTSSQMGFFDGFSDADRENRFYECFSAAHDVGGRFPPVRSFARIFFPRRKLQVFTSNEGAATMSILVIDPKLAAGGRRGRFWRRPRGQA